MIARRAMMGLLGDSGGKATPTVKTITVTPSSNTLSITFSGLDAEPVMFAINHITKISLSSTSKNRYVTGIFFDGNHIAYTSIASESNSIMASSSHSTNNVKQSYSNGTLTITSASSISCGYFKSNISYELIYVY